jgi:large subunit ribosomal protein L32e
LEEVIEEFMSLRGIGKAKAKALYESGFDSIEKLRGAKVEDLVKVRGITKKNAEDIIAQLAEEIGEEKKEEKPEPEKLETEKPEPEKPEPEKPEEIIIEEAYRVKKKPELGKELKEKLLLRKKIKKRTPKFLREEWFRYKRIPRNWRRPDGISSKMRMNLKYRPSKVRVGFRGPKEVRGLHPSGFKEVMIYNVKELEKVDPKTQAIRIGSTVGMKKRLEIAKEAEKLDIRVLNMRV